MGGDALCEGGEGQPPMPQDCGTRTTLASMSSMRKVFYEDSILPYSLQCIHPRLRDAVEVQDRAALLYGAELLVGHGSPEDVARSIAPRQEEEEEKQQEKPPKSDISGNAEELDTVFICGPSFASPRTVHASLHEADEELGQRCLFFLSTFTEGGEAYHVPYDVQRRVVPLLYSWIVDWDFLRRDTKCWERVVACFCRTAQSRRRRLSVRPDFSLPWRPLVALLMSLFFQSTRVMDLHIFHGMRKVAGQHLERVCELAALHFGPDALEGLWETFAPYFSSEREEAPLMLCLLSHLIPVHRLVDDATGAPLPLTERIVRFLLSDALFWQQQSGNWLAYSLKIVFKMALHHIGVVDFDKYAEPLFSMMLFELRLPITDSTTKPQRNIGFGVLSDIPLFRIEKYEMASAQGFVGNMLPRCTDSPLWNHLRRFILATSVFLRPNATDGAVLLRVFSFYSSLVVAIHRRMKTQASYEYTRATRVDHRVEGRRSLPLMYLWDRDAVECFVTLTAPVLLSSLHHRLDDVPRIVGLLASLSPATVQPLILPYVNTGLRSRVESPAQRALALRLLTKSLYPLSESRDTRDNCWLFLADVLPSLLAWVNPSLFTLSARVLELIFATCSVTSLLNLLGGQGAECEFAVTLMERIFECSSHVELSKGSDLELLVHVTAALLRNVSDETLTCCVKRALREAEVQGTPLRASVVSCLLEPLARYAPDRVMRWASCILMPPLQSASTPEVEVVWCAQLLAGCVRGAGLMCFSHRHQLLQCIQWQVSYVTKPKRLVAAATIYSALFAALTETVCTEARATSSCAEAPTNMDAKAADILEVKCMDDAHKVEMGFCRSSSVQMTWREASEEHITYVLDVYQRFMQDIVDIIQDIERVAPPTSADGSSGLRRLFPSLSSSSSGGDSNNNNNNNNSPENKKNNTSGKCHDGDGDGDNNNNDNNNNASGERQATTEVDDEGNPFTPQNVLRGALQWLRNVQEINQELRMQFTSVGSPNMVPWWVKPPKAPWRLLSPSSSSSSLSSSSSSSFSLLPWARQDAIHDLLFRQALRHLVGNVVGKDIVGAALQLDQSLVVQGGRPPFDSTHSSDTDVRSLHCLLAILAEQCNIVPRMPLCYDHYRMYNRGPGCFGWCVVETLEQRRYFPVTYWCMKAESFIRSRRRQLMHVVSPKCFSEVVSIAHTLLLSPHQSIQADCCHILTCCMSLMGRESSHRFLNRHFTMLCRIVELWKRQNEIISHPEEEKQEQLLRHVSLPGASSPTALDDDDCDDGCSSEDAECAESNAIVFARNHNDERSRSRSISISNHDGTLEHDVSEEEKRNAMRNTLHLKRELASALSLASIGFDSPYFYYDRGLIWRAYEMLIQLPEQLSAKRVGACISLKKMANLSGLSTMECVHAVRLSDELLALAAKFANPAPDRALRCLMMIVAIYRPSTVALLSPQSVSLLFRLAVNAHVKLRAASLHILQTLLLSLKRPHRKAHVLVRRSSLEDDENLSFFRRRHDVLKQKCPSFFGMRDVGFVFLPKTVRVDANHVSPDMFNDGAKVTVPAEDVVLRKTYTEGIEKPTYLQLEKQQQQQARDKLIDLIGYFSGILDEDLNPSTVLQKPQHLEEEQEEQEEGGDTLETRLRKGWMWNVIQLRHDQKTFSQCRMRLWKALGKLLGVDPAVRVFTRIVYLRTRDYMNLARGDSAEGKESPQWLFSCIADLMVAAIRISKRHPAARQRAMTCYVETVMQVCTSRLVPHEVLDSFVQTVSALHGTLKTNEVWLLYERLFAALTPPPPPPPPTTEETVVVVSAPQNMLTSECDVDAGASTGTPWCLGRSQEMTRVLTVMVQLLCVFAYEVNVLLLPQLCQRIMANKRVFFHSTVSRVRQCAASVIQQIMRLCLHQSNHISSSTDVQDNIISFIDRAERLVELPSPDPLPTLAPWSATPALGAAPNPFMATTTTTTTTATNTTTTTEGIALSPALPFASSPPLSDAFSLDGYRNTTNSTGLLALKTLTMCWFQPPAPLLEVRAKDVIPLLARSLDTSMQEADDLGVMLRATLDSIAYVRLSKNAIHGILDLLCDILEEKKPYGRSRQAKVTLSCMLRLVLFINLHRIGKFAVMQSVSHTALKSIGHGDGRVRGEGRLLLAVLTKVASVEQTQALVKGFFDELRESSSSSSSCSSAAVVVAAGQSLGVCFSPQSPNILQERLRNRRRIALLLALCSILSANLGAIPAYVPRLMERLAASWNDPSPEVQRAVKRAFEDWWRSHCDAWELEHKPHFTAAQIEVILPLLTAPMYLV